MKKTFRYAIFDLKDKFFCVRESEGDTRKEFESAGYKVVDYTKSLFTASDIDLYTNKGFTWDGSGSFLTVNQ